MGLIALMLALLLIALATLPAWPYAQRWGYYPTGACGLICVIMAGLVLIGRV